MGNKKILVVEDEIVIAEEIVDRLKGLGFDVPCKVTSGEDAIKKSEETRPDLVLMDIKLEGDMDGIGAARQIRERFDIPVIYLTAYSDEKTLNNAKITQPYGYVTKPYEDRDLEITIEMALYKHKIDMEIKRHEENLENMVEERTAEIRELKEFNENIVQSIQEGLIIEDKEGIVTFGNSKMLEILGVAQKDLVGRHWSELFSSEFEKKVTEENLRVEEGEKRKYEAALNLGDRKLEVLVNVTPRMKGGRYVGNLKEFIDITDSKKAEERLRQRALKYKIERGKSYLVLEKTLDRGVDVLSDLIGAGYSGMVISRTSHSELAENFEEEVEIMCFSEEKTGRGVIPPKLDIVGKSIEDFISRDSAVLLDRLDYLVVQNGFNEVLKFLNKQTEKIHSTKSILLVVVDPDTLSSQELSLLEKEIPRVEAKYYIKLEADRLDILDFIKKENDEARTPVHKDIMETFSITRPTATKKIKELKAKGLIIEKKKGRFKTLELTAKGKEALQFP